MNVFELQSDLAAELRNNILAHYNLYDSSGKKVAINVYEQDLPVPRSTSSGEEDEESDMLDKYTDDEPQSDPYPYVIVRVGGGRCEDPDEAEKVSVMLIIGVFDNSGDRQGHKDVLNIISKIADRFYKYHILAKKYVFNYPLEWTLVDEDTHPYYFGGVSLTFERPTPRRELTNLI